MTNSAVDGSALESDTSSKALDQSNLEPTGGPVGVHLLRRGWNQERLFLIPGLEGSVEELAPLVDAFACGQDVYVVSPPAPATVRTSAELRHIAAKMVHAVRRRQLRGPYHLGGYSYGGLLAYEMAQQLRAVDESVGDLILIDAVYDERYWPKAVWLEGLARRAGRHLGRIAALPPKQAGVEVANRSRRLVQRLLRRRAGAADGLQAGGTAAARHAYAAIGGYRPAFYDGTMTFIASSVDRHFGVDTARLWSSLVGRLDVRRVAGDHLSILSTPDSAADVARIIDHRLGLRLSDWPGLRPLAGFERPMIVTTMKWFSAARLTNALVEAGFLVTACRPRSHPLDVVDGVVRSYGMNRLDRTRSIHRAIQDARPDLILADDERALAHLRRVHSRLRVADPELAALIARSLGSVADWQAVTSRTGLANIAIAASVQAPPTAVVDQAALRVWSREHGFPCVLKTDGSWGGRGVAVIEGPEDIDRAWRAIGRPPNMSRALKRLAFNLEAGPLIACGIRRPPVVNVQRFLNGREAIATVACLNGQVLSLVCLEVVHALPNRGAATVVKVIENPRMACAAETLVRRLGLSGFCGMDFILTEADEPMLIELNPRVTPTAYLLVEGDFQRPRTIALFPADPIGGLIDTGDIDVPVRSPSLVRLGHRMASRRHGLLARVEQRLSQQFGR